MKEPDMKRLQRISRDVERLGRAGQLTREAYEVLRDEAEVAAGEHAADVLGCLWTKAVYFGLEE